MDTGSTVRVSSLDAGPELLITSIDLAGPDVIKFGIESKHSSPLTSTNVFISAVSEALLEMKAVCSVDESSSPVVSHL